jgi:hypothetical protein
MNRVAQFSESFGDNKPALASFLGNAAFEALEALEPRVP